MQNDCDVYVDPEEDEVFFGCVSEREKNVCAKLVKHTGSNPKEDSAFDEISNIDVDENNENILTNEQATRGILISEANKESNNTSVELDHNYSTPMKHKIDKTILTTPKSIVKADKDGGFLKVLSEIALVKAEAEGDKQTDEKKEDEDKENQMVRPIPVIKVTEATPEKASIVSPPKSVNSQLRRFRIIYNSPQSEDNVDLGKGKSQVSHNFESCRNLRNKCLDQDLNMSGIENILNDDRDSIDLIDFDKSIIPNEVLIKNEKVVEEVKGEKKNVSELIYPIEEKEEIKEGEDEGEEMIVPELEVKKINDDNDDEEPEVIAVLTPSKVIKSPKKPEEKIGGILNKFPPGYRFSKEARKIVEVLKKNAVDDTLDFTIEEIDLENVENSLLSPEPVSLDATVIPNAERKPQKLLSPKVTTEGVKHLGVQLNTVEKERHKLTPILSQSKIQGVKYFSERRVANQVKSGVLKKCAKKLPLEEKKPLTGEKGGKTAEKEASAVPSSKIPVFGLKSSRIPLHTSDRLVRPVTSEKTPLKTPTGKSYTNSKYKNIESPINAYINNKPTSLVVNVKSEVKKGSLAKVWRPGTTGSLRKMEKPSKSETTAKSVQLPYVEYKSATPYEVEKRPESRLPRLAPNVQKLIGSRSPRVLKHEGRFFVNTPMKHSTEDTIQADPYEVSLVLSKTAQKSSVK